MGIRDRLLTEKDSRDIEYLHQELLMKLFRLSPSPIHSLFQQFHTPLKISSNF